MRQNQTSSIFLASVVKQMKLILALCFFPILFASVLLTTAAKTTEKISNSHQNASFSAKTPIDHTNNVPELFIEEESTEEDELYHGYSSALAHKKYIYSFYELNYSSLVNNRFSHLLSAILQKAESPYFILYHSWKSELV
jgi:hypothetical protein